MKDNLAYYSVVLGEDKAQSIAPREVGPAPPTSGAHADGGASDVEQHVTISRYNIGEGSVCVGVKGAWLLISHG